MKTLPDLSILLHEQGNLKVSDKLAGRKNI